MGTRQDRIEVSLANRTLQRLQNGKGLEVACIEGALWVTLEGDNRDIALTPGGSFTIDRNGLTVLFALKPSVISVGRAARPEGTLPFRTFPEGRAA